MTIHYFSDVDGVPMIRMPVSQYDYNVTKQLRRDHERVTAWQALYKKAMADVDAWHALAREHGAEGQRPEDLRDTLTARIWENHHRSEAMYNEAIAALEKWRKLAIEHGARGATGDIIRGHLRTILVAERERKERDRYIRDRLGVLRRERDKATNKSDVAIQDLSELNDRFAEVLRERDEARAKLREVEQSDSDMISRAVVQAKTLDVWQSLARGYGLQGEGAELVDSLREFVDFLRSGQTVKLADVLELVRGERENPADHMSQTHTRLDRYRADNQDWRELANNFGCGYSSNPNMVANLKAIIYADRGNLSKHIEAVQEWRELAHSYGCDINSNEDMTGQLKDIIEGHLGNLSSSLKQVADWRKLAHSYGHSYGCDGDPSSLRKYIDRLIGRVSELERRAARSAYGESPLDDRMASVAAHVSAARDVWRDLAKPYGCVGGNDAATRENLTRYIDGLANQVAELRGELRAQREAPTVPRQPVEIDEEGVARYRENAAVSWLLDQVPQGANAIAMQGFSDSDQTQLAQLSGYSVSGAGGLSYFDPAVTAWADAEVERLTGLEVE